MINVRVIIQEDWPKPYVCNTGYEICLMCRGKVINSDAFCKECNDWIDEMEWEMFNLK